MMGTVFIGLADLKDPPNGFETYIWSCEGCVNGIKWCKQNNKNYTVIADSWGQESYVNETVAYLKELRQKIVEQLTIELNHYHETTYSVEAWSIILFEWLELFLFSYYDKYIRILSIIKQDVPAVVYVEHSKETIPATDYDGYLERLLSDWFALHQYSMIFQNIGVEFHNLKLAEIDCCGPKYDVLEKKESRISWKRRLAKHLEDALIGVLYRSDRDNVLVASDVPFPKIWLLKTRFLGTKISRLFSTYGDDNEIILLNTINPDASWRDERLVIKDAHDAFCSIVCKLIKKELPYVYLERHKRIKEYVLKYYGKFLNAKVLIHGANTIHSDELLKIICALMHDNGSIICCVQHGGNYGIEKCWHYDDEFALSDIFYTYGWNREEDCGCMFKPMPSVKLMFEKNQEGFGDGSILYVSYSFWRYQFRPGRPEFEYTNVIRDEVAFLKGISLKARKKIRARLYMSDFGWGIKEKIENAVPNLTFDTEPNFCKSLEKADFCIFSDWETTVNQALLINKPFIVRRDLSYMMDEAIPDIEKMHSVGVVCYSWDELAQRVDELEGSWQDWWKDSKTQNVIVEMRKKYAWCPDDAEEIWKGEFKRLLSVKDPKMAPT